MDKRKVFLVLLAVAAMVPLEHIITEVRSLRRFIGWIIRGEPGHIVGHLVLFGGLTILVLILFNLKLEPRTAVLIVIGVLTLGMGQEIIQLQVKDRGFGWPEIFDLAVDLTGAGLGWWVYARLLPYGRYLRIAYFILRSAQPKK
jgi:hypothetical protein